MVLAVSRDSKETLAKFRAELGASYPFIADPEGKLVKLFDTKTPLLPVASRRTFEGPREEPSFTGLMCAYNYRCGA